MTKVLLRYALAFVASALASLVASAGTVTYYHNDIAGNPVAATNEQGQVIWRESYRPYGERTVNSAAASGNKIWFTSRRQDAETGLVYMGARYYDPAIGRFISTDPVGFDEKNLHSFNRYAYANNNPYKYVDPDGRAPFLLALIPILKSAAGWATVGFAATAGADAISQGAAFGQVDYGGAAKEGLNAAPAWALGGAAGEALVAAKGLASGSKALSGMGDLTVGEAKAIQEVVNTAGRPLEVVGSAARGGRKAGSDIDYVVSPSSLKHFEGLEGKLPSIDPKHGIIPGHANPNIGPSIRFEPK